MNYQGDKSPTSLRLLACLLLCLLLVGCRLPKGVLEKPAKNALPDYQASSIKSQVLSVLWRIPLVDPDNSSLEGHHHGIPVVSEDGRRVYAGANDGSFHCLDSKTGKQIWRKITGGPVESQPTLSGDVAYVGSSDGTLYAFRASDGETLWSHKTASSVDGQPVVADDRVLVMTDTNTLLCLEAQTGKWIWNYRREVPSGRFQVKGVSRPVVLDGKVYAGFSDGFLAMLSLKDGGVLELKKLAAKDAQFTDLDTDPIVVDKSLVVGSFSSGIIGLDLDGLKERWRYKAQGPSSLALAKNILYFTTADSRVVALDIKNARPLWVFKAKKGELSKPVVAGNWLLVSSREYSLLVLDRATGALLQLFNPGKGSHSAPAVHRDRLYWVSNGEILYSMGITQ